MSNARRTSSIATPWIVAIALIVFGLTGITAQILALAGSHR